MDLPELRIEEPAEDPVAACTAEIEAALRRHGCVLRPIGVPNVVHDARGGWRLVVEADVRVERRTG